MIQYIRAECQDRDLQKVQDTLVDIFNELGKNPIVSNVKIVRNITINTTDTIVNHMLNRNINGWIIVNKNGVGDIYQSATVNSMPKASIILNSSMTVTADILFF